MSSLLLVTCDAPSNEADLAGVKGRSVVSTDKIYKDEAPSPESGGEANTDKSVLRWAKPGLAPLFISDGANKGGGVGDQVFTQVQKLIPQYQHVNLDLNYSRLLEELRKGSDVCAILYHSVEREKIAVYSQPIIATPSYQLYVSAKGLERFQNKTGWAGGQASFEKIMSMSQGLKIAITPGQSYGSDRGEILHRHADKAEIIKGFSGQDALVKMLVAGRMDMMLGFPWVINYEMARLNFDADLIKVPLHDVSQYEAAYVACADTPLGRAVVSAIDKISPPIHHRVKDLLSRWLTEKENQSYYRVYREYFFEGKPLS